MSCWPARVACRIRRWRLPPSNTPTISPSLASRPTCCAGRCCWSCASRWARPPPRPTAGADEVITTSGGSDLSDDDLADTRFWHTSASATGGGTEPDRDADLDDGDYDDIEDEDFEDERGRW